MKAFILDRYGRSQSLRLGDVARPTVGDTDVLVEVHAAGVNPVDYKIRDGEFKLVMPLKLPLIMGNDVAGVVVEVGAKVSEFKIGDEVYARPEPSRIGTFAEYIAIDQADVALKPKSLSMVEAASVPLAALTAWQALFEKAAVKTDDKVFIQAGSGGVGIFAIQLAKHAGAKVATSAGAASVDMLEQLGADIILDYRRQDFGDILSGYDFVLNSQDAAALTKSFGVLKPGGDIISISGPPDPAFARSIGANWIVRQVIGLIGRKARKLAARHVVNYAFLLMRSDGAQLREIAELIDAGSVRTIVDKVFPFEQTNEALAYVETGRTKGKVVIQIK